MLENELLKNQVKTFFQNKIQFFQSENKVSLPSGRELVFKIEYSRNEKFGDYSTSFCLENSVLFQKKPLQLANEILPFLQNESLFEKVDITPPGFINFRIKEKYIKEYLFRNFIESKPFPQVLEKQKINLEFVSANPTGPLNIVSARASAIGEAIANLLKSIGHSVEKEFYVNDYGNQTLLLGYSFLARYRESFGEEIIFDEKDIFEENNVLGANFFPKEGYRGEYIVELLNKILKVPENKTKIENLFNQKNFKELAVLFSRLGIDAILNWQKADLKNFDVEFDNFYYESVLHANNKILDCLEKLKNSGFCYEEDKKLFFSSTKFGDDKDRVIVRDDGRPTYFLADIAYHLTKIERGYSKIIDIWGPDHYGYIQRLKGALVVLGFPENSFEVIITQQVNLLKNGEKVKMSKRAGNIQTMGELIEFLGKNGKDVGRYFFNMRSIQSSLDFDLGLAIDESENNPVYYIQYAHARICSIFREIGNTFDSNYFFNYNFSEDLKRILFWISKFPEEILDSANSREPHRLATYLLNLSKQFNSLYSKKEFNLKNANKDLQSALALVFKSVQTNISLGLQLMGISAPEKM